MATATPTVTQFTDPMCTWCWGSEPILRHLQVSYGDQIRIEYVMGGLVEDFDGFHDAANDISEPSDVAPHWEEAADRHGMPVDTTIFRTDPAQSSYPASVAFAAARLVDETLAGQYLRRLREAYTTQVRNVNRRNEQITIAESVGLDVAAFTTVLDDGTAREAFEADLRRSREAGVRAFPTYRLTGPAGERLATGFQSFEALTAALTAVAPSLEPSSPPTVQEFVADYGPVATQEVAELYDQRPKAARQRLAALADDGVVDCEPRGTGLFWHAGGDD